MTKTLWIGAIFFTSLHSFASQKTICGATDDRDLSFELKVGRLSTLDTHKGCTATLIGDSCAITAGHCAPVLIRAEFNTPISVDANPQPSKSEDVYLIDQDTIKLEDNGPGKDWAVFKFKRNETTGKLPGEVQGYYNVSFNQVKKGDTIRITGYGVDSGDVTGNFAQQTHTGKIVKAGGFFSKTHLKHTADTMGGNSGSSIILEKTQEIIGIHTHGGCYSGGGANQGTLINKHNNLVVAIKACLNSEK